MITNARVRGLVRDRRGFVMLWFAMSLPVTIGMAGVMIDTTRLSALHTELQSIADAAALAGARELDGSDTSIEKARTAAKSLLNKPLGATSTSGDQILEPEFGSMDQDAHKCNLFAVAEGGYTMAQNQLADCIRVTTQNRDMSIYLARLVKLGTTASAQARATAESRTIACDVTPLRMCLQNPTYMDSVKAGTQFQLKALGKNGENGDFGIVDPPNGLSTAEGLATERPNFCFTEQNTVRPGGVASATEDGLNVRFAKYPTNGKLNGYSPAPNVTKGWSNTAPGSSCNKQDSDIAAGALPRDTDWAAKGPFGLDIIGDGETWKTQIPAYLAAQKHPAGVHAAILAAKTRYEVYLAEMGLTKITEATPVSPSALEANTTTMPQMEYGRGAPKCGPPASIAKGTDARRRIIYAAVVNCDQNHGNSTPPRRSTRYVKFFLTEPVTPASAGGVVFAEFLEILKPNSNDGKLHYMVQLVQ